MKYLLNTAIVIALSLSGGSAPAQEKVTTSWGGDALKVYETGFMHMVMKAPGGGVQLFNMELVENDSPGSGASEKGISNDVIWGKQQARKLFFLEDPRARKAWLVYFVSRKGKFPLSLKVNGKPTRIDSWDEKKNREMYRWNEFPAEWLVKGKNTIDLSCPEASSEQDGWQVYLSRADEFEDGGGDPAHVGETSFKSLDGGETWKRSPFGPLGQTAAEYSIRLSLDRSVKTGWLASPVIDLWKGDAKDTIVPQREIRKLKFSLRSEAPEETTVECFIRRGSDPDPFSSEWEPYQFIGQGAAVDYETGGAALNRRYVQFRMVLSTKNPLKSPVIKSMQLTAELNQRVPLHQNIRVVEADNPPISYSSLPWEWEKWDRPEFSELRKRENLDEVIAGSRTEFDAQVKLLHYVFKRWYPGGTLPEYPGWDALSILRRIDTSGGGGMCIQFANVLGGMCMAYGWQARLINCIGHEVIEVWNDEYGKWIFFDAEFFDHYNYDPATAEPLDMLELHKLYLDYYFPNHTIDWMNDMIPWRNTLPGKPLPVRRGIATPNDKILISHFGKVITSGFANAAFMRLIPRNNWYEKSTPRPLTHGNTWWPWDGYINWYDDRTPPKRQYAWHTDRPQDMWPDLNLVHVDATQGFGNDRLFLRFETYTPNFSHFEVNADDTGWKQTGERWTWLLQSGRNTLKVRAVSKLGVKGKPSSFVLNHADAPFGE
ncbi:MAG: transglutaminase-like domain-containing protein [Candidatus Latescibacter sp.]|nr:transglutaminase-like domain-containing protein [Candidatus Latescibacter sp.]